MKLTLVYFFLFFPLSGQESLKDEEIITSSNPTTTLFTTTMLSRNMTRETTTIEDYETDFKKFFLNLTNFKNFQTNITKHDEMNKIEKNCFFNFFSDKLQENFNKLILNYNSRNIIFYIVYYILYFSLYLLFIFIITSCMIFIYRRSKYNIFLSTKLGNILSGKYEKKEQIVEEEDENFINNFQRETYV